MGRKKESTQPQAARDRIRRRGAHFHGPTIERVDDRYDYGEPRVYAIGLVDGLEITVIYTDIDDEERRIISAWRSEPHERRSYWKALEGEKQ